MVLRIDTAVLHSTGGRAYNEDAWGELARGSTTCWVVCDGAGGHGGGDVASRLAVEHALHTWSDCAGGQDCIAGRSDARPLSASPHEPVVPASLHDAVAAADRAVHDGQRLGEAVADMRTTIAMLALDLQQCSACWAHVGDTRVYHFRNGHLRDQTRDHSLVQQLLQAGLVDGDPSRSHPRRNVLTAALGGGLAASSTDVGLLDGPLQPGDAFLVCTDGFWEYVLEGEMERELTDHRAAASTLAALEDTLRGRARSGHDNYTAVLVEVMEETAGSTVN